MIEPDPDSQIQKALFRLNNASIIASWPKWKWSCDWPGLDPFFMWWRLIQIKAVQEKVKKQK